jgi:hypothetical protein
MMAQPGVTLQFTPAVVTRLWNSDCVDRAPVVGGTSPFFAPDRGLTRAAITP